MNFILDLKTNIELCLYLISNAEKSIDNKFQLLKKQPWTKINNEYFNYKSRSTLINHVNYLLEKNYLFERDGYYIFNYSYFKLEKNLADMLMYCNKPALARIFLYLYSNDKKQFTILELSQKFNVSPFSVKASINQLICLNLIKISKCYYSRDSQYCFIVDDFLANAPTATIDLLGDDDEEEEYEN